jgi:hypothetical protein
MAPEFHELLFSTPSVRSVSISHSEFNVDMRNILDLGTNPVKTGFASA